MKIISNYNLNPYQQATGSSIKFKQNAELLSQATHSDAQYMFYNGNINFKSKHNLHRLSTSELNHLKSELYELRGINFGEWKANYAAQAIIYLLKHPIMKHFRNENIVTTLDKLKAKLLTDFHEKKDSETLLEFADYLCSDNVKPVIEKVKESLGDILFSCDSGNIQSKMDFINYLVKHPELLKKNISFADYISKIHKYNTGDIMSTIKSPNPPTYYKSNLNGVAQGKGADKTLEDLLLTYYRN